MKILHTSDWHLGRQLHHQNLLADQQFVLDKILEIVARQKVEVVLISGDIYDRSVPPADAVELLDEVLQKLNFDLRVPVVMITGNHDGPERLSFGARHGFLGGIRLDMLFIDEGFGSLDVESQDLAINSLVALQKTGRMIGLISHVPELRERIEKRIDLKTSHCGSTAHLVAV